MSSQIRPSRKRAAGTMIVLALIAAAFVVAAPPAIAAAESWGAPVHIASGRLRGVSCASSSFCVAVGENGQAFKFDGFSWSPGATIDAGQELRGVSCPTNSFCAAAGAGGQLLTFNGTTWSTTQTTPAVYFAAVSCPSAAFCMAVGNDGVLSNGGDAAIYNGSTWSSPSGVEGAGEFEAVSCASPTFCEATTHEEQAYIYRSGVWEQPPARVGLMDVQAVSCAAESFCMAASFNEVFRFNGSTWGAGQELWEGAIRAISCPSTSFCMAVGAGYPGARATSFNGSSWSTAAPIEGAVELMGVSCPSSAFCAAVDSEGYAVIYAATPPPIDVVGPPLVGGGGSGGSTGARGGGGPLALPPVLGPPPANVIYAALVGLLRLKPPTIANLLKSGGWNVAFTAPGAGVLRIEWITGGAHSARTSKPTVVAAAAKTFTTGGRGTIRLPLTAAGRRLMRHRQGVPITETATFRAAGSPVTLKRFALVVLKRRH